MSPRPKLTRRRILGSIVTIGAGSVAAGAGTMAFFSDEKTSKNNTVKAGTLTLNLDNGDEQGSKTVNVTNAKPGDSGSGASQVTNSGTIDGFLDLEVANVRNQENGRNQSEQEAGDGSTDQGELGDNLNVTIGFDGDDEKLTDNRPAGGVDTENDEAVGPDGVTINEAEGSYDLNFPLNSGQSANLVIEWEIPGSTGNEIQSDQVLFDVVVTLSQQQ